MLKVYSAEWCGFCFKVKEFLTKKGIPFEVIDIDTNLEAAEELMNSGYQTLPQVFKESGDHIGGCDATIALYNN